MSNAVVPEGVISPVNCIAPRYIVFATPFAIQFTLWYTPHINLRVPFYTFLDTFNKGAGEIVGVVGLKCSSGDTLTEGKKTAMTNIVVPECVVSLAISISSGE